MKAIPLNFRGHLTWSTCCRRLQKLYGHICVLTYLLTCIQLASVVVVAAGDLPQNTDTLIEKSQSAKTAMNEGRYEEAAKIYSELLRAMPDNPGLLMNLGLALHSSGRYREAIIQFQSTLRLNPTFTPASLMLGLAHLKLGERETALESLKRVVDVEPENKIALFEMADTYLSLGRPAEAERYFRRLTELDPGNAKAWQGLGLSYVASSSRVFDKLESDAPASPYRDLLLAQSRAARQQYRSAFQLYQQALTKAPQLRNVHQALAEIYRSTGHEDWATIEEDRERRLSAPDCRVEKLECEFRAGNFAQILTDTEARGTAESFYWRAQAYSELAKSAFARLAQLSQAGETHELLAKAYRVQGLHGEAVREWQEALKFAPQDARLKSELARSLWQNGDYTPAMALLSELLKTEAESPELNYEMVESLLQTQSVQQAIPYLEKVVKQQPRFLTARASLAQAYVRAARQVEAIPHLEAALQIDSDGQLHYMLARAYKAAGREAEARLMIKKSEDLATGARNRSQKDVEITAPH